VPEQAASSKAKTTGMTTRIQPILKLSETRDNFISIPPPPKVGKAEGKCRGGHAERNAAALFSGRGEVLQATGQNKLSRTAIGARSIYRYISPDPEP
jgi:hypothetical protein